MTKIKIMNKTKKNYTSWRKKNLMESDLNKWFHFKRRGKIIYKRENVRKLQAGEKRFVKKPQTLVTKLKDTWKRGVALKGFKILFQIVA